MNERVNHPEHYTAGGIECIDALEAATAGLEGIEAVCTANAIKYLWRWKRKNGVEDLQKAVWYIERLIKKTWREAGKLKGAIQMEKTMKTGKLEGLGAGSRFTYGGVEWAILERRANVALCLSADVLEERAFDEENKNDFAASSLRAYLNGEFMKKLCKAGASEDAFVPIVLDLTADDGLEKYGQDRAKIALLTCEMYRRFRDEIPEIKKWWWLATADSPRNHYARRVGTDGTLSSDNACYGHHGVRPLCCLKSDISVSYDEAQIKEHSGSRFADMIGKMIIDGLREGLESTNKNIRADNIKIETAEGDEAHKRAEAVDMMRHIAAAFDIPATIDEEPEKKAVDPKHAEAAGAIGGMYRAYIAEGFTKAQAMRLVMAMVQTSMKPA